MPKCSDCTFAADRWRGPFLWHACRFSDVDLAREDEASAYPCPLNFCLATAAGRIEARTVMVNAQRLGQLNLLLAQYTFGEREKLVGILLHPEGQARVEGKAVSTWETERRWREEQGMAAVG